MQTNELRAIINTLCAQNVITDETHTMLIGQIEAIEKSFDTTIEYIKKIEKELAKHLK